MSRRRELTFWSLYLYTTWVAAFVAFEGARTRWPALDARGPATVWWSVCKLVIWVVPVWLLVRRRDRAVWAWLGLDHAHGMTRGCVVTAVFLVGVALVDALIPGRWPKPIALGADDATTLILITLYGPFVEEVLYRGYALRALIEGGSTFWRANLLSTFLFTLLHVPGWMFMARPMGECLSLAPQIAFAGLLFGSLRAPRAEGAIQGMSLWPCVLLHVCNNAWRAGWFVRAVDALR